ncbi:MAG: malonyl-ACP O-methyltransferase BioC [Halothiobacillaceae bacterium]|jgi:malonyl-CoA O-methyltransferase|nr:malonyl-ACP O-methyltransferase BioC [Halothiobacillaceae bacterium]
MSEYELDRRRVRRAFDRAAGRYDDRAVLQAEVRTRLLERLDYLRVEPANLLDLGTGTGHALDGLRRRFSAARVLGLDLSECMLDRARRRGRLFSRPRVICADMESLPIADQSVDLVFSSLALQWSTRPEQVFAEVRRVLRPGGVFSFATLGPDTLRELRDAWGDGGRVHAFFDMHDLGDALMRVGLREVVMDVERLVLTYPTVRDVLEDLRGIGAANALQGRSRGLLGRESYRQMERRYEDWRDEAGTLPATYEVVYGQAWCPAPLSPAENEKKPLREFFVPLERIRNNKNIL